MVREQMSKGSNLMDQYAEQLDMEKQVIQLGYEDPEDLRRQREKLERDRQELELKQQQMKEQEELLQIDIGKISNRKPKAANQIKHVGPGPG